MIVLQITNIKILPLITPETKDYRYIVDLNIG